MLLLKKRATDKRIIKRILKGDKDLYEEIVRKYNGYLYKVGRTYGFNHDDVEDLMQETYVEAFIHLKDFEGRSSFKTWLVTIMLHQCYHKKHKASSEREKTTTKDFETAVQPLLSQEKTDGIKTIQNLELKEIIEEAILKTPEDYRMVFSLRELNGLSVAETAKALDISESNVKVRLHRAKKMLQDEIGKSYTPKEIFDFNLIYCDGIVERVMRAIEEL